MNVKDIDALLQSGIEQGDFPGVHYRIVYSDGTTIGNHLGFKQIEPQKVCNSKDTQYDCASLTKVISTTTMIMKLIEEQRLSFDTTISSILPRFKHTEVTIRDCLTHSSGLPADIPKANTLIHRIDVERHIYGFDLIYPTGSKIVYSDIGFILLGFVIERMTGKRLSQYAQEVIFNPLQMEHTSYHPTPELCAPTEWRQDTAYNGLLQGLVHDEKAFALRGEAGHAGLFSTTEDIATFIQSILRNDGRVLQPQTVDEFFPCRIKHTNDNNVPVCRAYGWDKPTKGGTAGNNVSFEHTILHTGFTGCNMWIEREKGIGFVMLSNAVHPHRANNNIIKYRHKIGNIIIPATEVLQ